MNFLLDLIRFIFDRFAAPVPNEKMLRQAVKDFLKERYGGYLRATIANILINRYASRLDVIHGFVGKKERV